MRNMNGQMNADNTNTETFSSPKDTTPKSATKSDVKGDYIDFEEIK